MGTKCVWMFLRYRSWFKFIVYLRFPLYIIYHISILFLYRDSVSSPFECRWQMVGEHTSNMLFYTTFICCANCWEILHHCHIQSTKSPEKARKEISIKFKLIEFQHLNHNFWISSFNKFIIQLIDHVFIGHLESRNQLTM